MIPNGEISNILNTVGPKMLFLFVGTALACAALIYLFRQKDGDGGKNTGVRPAGMPKMPAHAGFPQPKAGGLRQLDTISLSPETQKKRAEALEIAKQGRLTDAAIMLESVNLQREAIDILEANGLLDDAAAMLMRMNRPNRAAVVYERNKRFEHAAAYFLRAKLVDDAKRCCKQIKEFSIALSTELAVLFAEAGDNQSALRLLAGINDKTRIMKVVREKFAYADLAQFLDFPAARQLLLQSLVLTDVEHMLQNMPQDAQSPLSRATLWVTESKKCEWLTPIFAYIGDKRGVASGFADKLSAELCNAYSDYILSADGKYFEHNKTAIEWAARSFHDAMRMLPAAKIYERLKKTTLAGKCWAIAGHSQNALNHLSSPEGDLSLAGIYQRELNKMGRFATDQKPLAEHERDALVRLFFNIDPDTEKNRELSPFSIAS
ncbi:MAG: hypothetical protein RLZZ488_129 [Pseudomonadota bacterium]|jgi:hypothetical protein